MNQPKFVTLNVEDAPSRSRLGNSLRKTNLV